MNLKTAGLIFNFPEDTQKYIEYLLMYAQSSMYTIIILIALFVLSILISTI